MKRRWRIAGLVVSAFACAAVGFGFGAATATLRGWGSPVVSVEVVNRSGRVATAVAVEYESCGVSTRTAPAALQPGERTTFRFLVCGEGGYKVTARLDNGTELFGGGGYVESGYQDASALMPDSIVSSL